MSRNLDGTQVWFHWLDKISDTIMHFGVTSLYDTRSYVIKVHVNAHIKIHIDISTGHIPYILHIIDRHPSTCTKPCSAGSVISIARQESSGRRRDTGRIPITNVS